MSVAMKVEQIINEMQTLLTKFRGRLRDKGKAGKYQGPKSERFPPTKMDYSETAGECTTIRDFCSNLNMVCPIDVRGCKSCKYWYKYKSTPDLPLHVRVAKALGNKPSKVGGNWYVVCPETGYYAGAGTYRIKDYPNDLEAAIGALEEYCRNNLLLVFINNDIGGASWKVHLFEQGLKDEKRQWYKFDESLPQAICLAIVAHREGR